MSLPAGKLISAQKKVPDEQVFIQGIAPMPRLVVVSLFQIVRFSVHLLSPLPPALDNSFASAPARSGLTVWPPVHTRRRQAITIVSVARLAESEFDRQERRMWGPRWIGVPIHFQTSIKNLVIRRTGVLPSHFMITKTSPAAGCLPDVRPDAEYFVESKRRAYIDTIYHRASHPRLPH